MKIETIMNFADISSANKCVNNTHEQQPNSLQYVKINDFYAFASDGCVYQITDELPETIILAYETDKGGYLNYAEDELDWTDIRDFIEDLEPDWEAADVSDCKDDIDLANKCFAFDSDETTEIPKNSLASNFYRCIEDEAGDIDIEKFSWFCGCKKKFCDKDTRFNPFDLSPDYTPYTNYYFF